MIDTTTTFDFRNLVKIIIGKAIKHLGKYEFGKVTDNSLGKGKK